MGMSSNVDVKWIISFLSSVIQLTLYNTHQTPSANMQSRQTVDQDVLPLSFLTYWSLSSTGLQGELVWALVLFPVLPHQFTLGRPPHSHLL